MTPTAVRLARGFVISLCVAIAGCSAHHENDLIVGQDRPDADTPKPSEAGSGPGSPGQAGTNAVPAGGSRALDADIQSREGVALDVVAVACAGECFEVVAVARGGYPPYTYRWEDGSTSAVRRLCPDTSQAFEVTATDRGYDSEEFKRAPETVTAAVTAAVLTCPDAGVRDAAVPQPADAGVPDAATEPEFKWEPICIPNGSFEDASGGSMWRVCESNNSWNGINISSGDPSLGQPPDGMYYLRMDPEPGRPETVSVRLCEPIKTGIGYYWTQAWALGAGSGPVVLEFHYSQSECGLDGKLSDLFPSNTWTRVCSNWPALWDAEWLTIRAVATGNVGGTVFIDELLDTSALCPIPTLQ